MNQIRKKLKQEDKQELGRLQDTIRRQEEELCNVKTERELYVRPQLENILDRVERIIVKKSTRNVDATQEFWETIPGKSI